MALNGPDVDLQLKMQSASFRVPFESIRKNFRNIRKLDEKQFKKVEELMNDLNKPLSKNVKLSKMKQLITSLKIYEKKIKSSVKIEDELLSRIQARIVKLNELRDIQNDLEQNKSNDGSEWINRERLLDWYRDQTNLLICDYLLKNNHSIENNPGLLLLKNLKYEKLIDSDIILASNRISSSILSGDLTSLLIWIDENKSYLNKIKSDIEFQARFQQFIEYVKTHELDKAINVFGNHLISFTKTNFEEISSASGLLTFIKKIRNDIDNVIFDKYKKLLTFERYKYLSDLFLQIYNKMNGILEDDPLLIYLSMGISSLKTKSCLCDKKDLKITTDFESIIEEKLNNQTKGLKSSTLCPICSSEFAQLSKKLPYSHNVKSYLFENPVMLPNGNIFDKLKLINYSSACIDLSEGEVKDPITEESFEIEELITMYPT